MSVEQELGARLQTAIKRNEPLSVHTSWKIGGPADYFLTPADLNELVEVVKYCSHNKLPLTVIGNGSNLLVRDGGIRGLLVEIGEPFSYLHRQGTGLKVGAGVLMPYLARAAARKGLSGLEFAGGIPGTLGGALIMNAGAFGSYIGSVVREVTVVRYDGAVSSLSREAIEFGYRTSSLSREGIIVEAALELAEGDSAELEGKVDFYLSERRRRHPQLPSAGSVFRNIPEQPAGRLIEAAGAKGMRIGGAQVSEQHANFIVNLGGATASDVIGLIEKIRQLVKEKFDVDLHPEVRVIGEEK